MFEVRLTAEWMATAAWVAEERPKRVQNQKPGYSEECDLVGATAEVAYAQHHAFSPSRISVDPPDPGWDFCHGVWQGRDRCHGKTVDVKASAKWPESWTVKAGELKMDWLVFAWVELPDLVVFKAKAPRWKVEPKGLVAKAGNKRLVWREEVDEIEEDDFK